MFKTEKKNTPNLGGWNPVVQSENAHKTNKNVQDMKNISIVHISNKIKAS